MKRNVLYIFFERKINYSHLKECESTMLIHSVHTRERIYVYKIMRIHPIKEKKKKTKWWRWWWSIGTHRYMMKRQSTFWLLLYNLCKLKLYFIISLRWVAYGIKRESQNEIEWLTKGHVQNFLNRVPTHKYLNKRTMHENIEWEDEEKIKRTLLIKMVKYIVWISIDNDVIFIVQFREMDDDDNNDWRLL